MDAVQQSRYRLELPHDLSFTVSRKQGLKLPEALQAGTTRLIVMQAQHSNSKNISEKLDIGLIQQILINHLFFCLKKKMVKAFLRFGLFSYVRNSSENLQMKWKKLQNCNFLYFGLIFQESENKMAFSVIFCIY